MKNNKINILALIPARSGSRGIKNKNIKKIGGIPLLAHSIKQAFGSKRVNRVVVSTDSEKIANAARLYKAEIVVRPKSIASDNTPMLPVVRHALKTLRAEHGYRADIIVLLQPTNPFREKGFIDKGISVFLRSKGADSLMAVSELVPKIGSVSGGYYKPHNRLGKRRQDLKALLRENGALYITTPQTMEKTRSLLGKNIIPYKTDVLTAFDIDEPLELRIAGKIMGA